MRLTSCNCIARRPKSTIAGSVRHSRRLRKTRQTSKLRRERREGRRSLKAIEYPNVKTVQIIFNIFRQRPAELFFEQAKKRKVGILARVPLASGMLTGKMKLNTKFETNDHRKYNRHGESFDRGETFSGVDYRTGLQAVEEIKRLVPHQ